MNKILNVEELNEVFSVISNKIFDGLYTANQNRQAGNFIRKLGYGDLIDNQEKSYSYIDVKNSRILVLAFKLNTNDLSMTAKKNGFDPNRIDFVEYSSKFNFNQLKHSSKYSDILIGPMPHKVTGMGDANSFLTLVERGPSEYPKIIRITNSSGKLKVTKTGFIEALKKTKYYKEILS